MRKPREKHDHIPQVLRAKNAITDAAVVLDKNYMTNKKGQM
jgi:hypothetical protein